jgi:hypothetical protein
MTVEEKRGGSQLPFAPGILCEGGHKCPPSKHEASLGECHRTMKRAA